MPYKKFSESEGLASLSRALRASHQTGPQADAVTRIDATHLDEPNKPKGATKRHAETPATGDAAEAKTKKKKRKVKEPPDSTGEGQHLQQQDTLGPSEDGPLEPKQMHAVGRQSMKQSREGQQQHEDDAGASAAIMAVPPHRTFRDVFVDMFTSAFSTDLYDLQQVEGEASQLPLLLRCVEQGGNLFSGIEKDLLCRQNDAALSP